MKRRFHLSALIFLLLVFCLRSSSLFANPAADTVYRNGYIYTVDAKSSVQEALAVREGKIVYIGTENGAKSYIGKDTKVIDLKGRMMMPGLVDGHMHPLQ